MKIINFLILIILFSTVSAYSGESTTATSILNESMTNSMVDAKESILKEEPASEVSPADVSKPATPVAEIKMEPVESRVTPPEEIKVPAKEEVKPSVNIEPQTKTGENSPSVKSTDSNIVHIVSTADGKTILGQLTVTEQSDGVYIKGTFKGVPNPGNHGIHIHENGSCADKGNGAGGHFNPDNRPHGDLEHRGHAEAHAGDMGNVEIDANGNGNLKFLLVASSLHEGRYNIAGKTIILHERADDFSQPTGNAGGRIGCGILPNPVH